jgi:hypothetical protein
LTCASSGGDCAAPGAATQANARAASAAGRLEGRQWTGGTGTGFSGRFFIVVAKTLGNIRTCETANVARVTRKPEREEKFSPKISAELVF